MDFGKNKKSRTLRSHLKTLVRETSRPAKDEESLARHFNEIVGSCEI